MQLNCPHCQKTLRVPEEFRGKQAKCPACAGIVSIPPQPSPGVTPVSAPTSARNCPRCGNALEQDAVFCVGCGLNLGADEGVANGTEAVGRPIDVGLLGKSEVAQRRNYALLTLVGIAAVTALVWWRMNLGTYYVIGAGAILGVVAIAACGTFQRLYLCKDAAGGWGIDKTRFLCFLPIRSSRYLLAEYDVLRVGGRERGKPEQYKQVFKVALAPGAILWIARCFIQGTLDDVTFRAMLNNAVGAAIAMALTAGVICFVWSLVKHSAFIELGRANAEEGTQAVRVFGGWDPDDGVSDFQRTVGAVGIIPVVRVKIERKAKDES